MKKIPKIITPSVYKGGFEELSTMLYDNSAFTFEGLIFSPDLPEQLNTVLVEKGLKEVHTFYLYSGKDMNEKYDLTGDNAYPDDLSFVSFCHEDQDTGRLAMVKLEIGARWFDDIVDNNKRNNG